MSERLASAREARRLEALLRTATTALAAADHPEFEARLDEVHRCLTDLESLLDRTRDSLPWPRDAEARLSVSRLEIRRLREGKARRSEAIATVRLLVPRFEFGDEPDVPTESALE